MASLHLLLIPRPRERDASLGPRCAHTCRHLPEATHRTWDLVVNSGRWCICRRGGPRSPGPRTLRSARRAQLQSQPSYDQLLARLGSVAATVPRWRPGGLDAAAGPSRGHRSDPAALDPLTQQAQRKVVDALLASDVLLDPAPTASRLSAPLTDLDFQIGVPRASGFLNSRPRVGGQDTTLRVGLTVGAAAERGAASSSTR